MKTWRVLVYFILLAIFVVLTGKVLFYPSASALYFYGITVTAVLFTLFFVAFHFYRDPALQGHLKKRPLVTCMVAVKNEEELIERCVNSFLEQTYENKEIIVVNDASTDGTKKKLDSIKGIKVIHLPFNVGKKRALAQAMLRAKGEIFVFTDSDSIVQPTAVEQLVRAFNSDPDIGAVSGHCRALNAEKNLLTRVQDSWYEGQFSIRKAFESVFGAVQCVSGPLAAFRREAIYNFIPAWEADTFLGQEFKFATDRTLTGFVLGNRAEGMKLKRRHRGSPFLEEDYPLHNWKVVYSKAARCLTKVPETFKALMRQQIRWKKSFIRNIFFTGRFYWRKPLLPSLFYYFHIIFVIAGPFIVFRYLFYLPYHGNLVSALLYFFGILFVGFMFALAYKVEHPQGHGWVYRPLMSLLSTLVLSWLLFYAAVTIRRNIWHRS